MAAPTLSPLCQSRHQDATLKLLQVASPRKNGLKTVVSPHGRVPPSVQLRAQYSSHATHDLGCYLHISQSASSYGFR
eukprot:3415471-Rhodomonas_salina.1